MLTSCRPITYTYVGGGAAVPCGGGAEWWCVCGSAICVTEDPGCEFEHTHWQHTPTKGHAVARRSSGTYAPAPAPGREERSGDIVLLSYGLPVLLSTFVYLQFNAELFTGLTPSRFLGLISANDTAA